MNADFKNTQILILAAGKSKRMGGDKPKALTPLKGKTFLQRIVSTLATLNLSPIIVVGHKRQEVMEAIGPNLVYAVQEEQLGTGHAVGIALPFLSEDTRNLLVLSTDQPLISSETIQKILEVHQTTSSTITLGTVSLPNFDGWRKALEHFGRIIRNQNGQVEKIIEFKDATPEQKLITEVNPAVYTFNVKWLKENINHLKNQNAQKEYYLTDLVEIACKSGKKVNAVTLANNIEGMQPNTKEELAILEGLMT